MVWRGCADVFTGASTTALAAVLCVAPQGPGQQAS